MISKISERLRELRLERGYSQEELADRMLVTRQAISKWERGDALPDTENLIALAEIYGVSIDELVGRTPREQGGDVCREVDKANTADAADDPRASVDTADMADDSRASEDAPKGQSGGEDDDDGDEDDGKGNCGTITRVLYELPYPVVTTVLFLVLGFIWGIWDVAWILFVTIPLYYSIVECVKTGRISPFNYPVFVTCVYLFAGMQFELWHPGWIIYVTVPIFYSVAAVVDKRRRKESE